MLCDNTPIVEALLRAGKIAALPKMKHILKGLVPTSATVTQDNLGIVVIENALYILGSLPFIKMGFVELPYHIFRRFQVRGSTKDFIDCFIATKER